MNNIVLYNCSFVDFSEYEYVIFDSESDRFSGCSRDLYLQLLVEKKVEEGEFVAAPDYQGLYFCEKSIFSGEIRFFIGSLSGRDVLYLDGFWDLDKVCFDYFSGFFIDEFSVFLEGELFRKFCYLKPFWRLITMNEFSWGDVCPLGNALDLLKKKPWATEHPRRK